MTHTPGKTPTPPGAHWSDRPLASCLSIAALCLLAIGFGHAGLSALNDVALDRIERGVE